MPARMIQEWQCGPCWRGETHVERERHYQMNLFLSRLDEDQRPRRRPSPARASATHAGCRPADGPFLAFWPVHERTSLRPGGRHANVGIVVDAAVGDVDES